MVTPIRSLFSRRHAVSAVTACSLITPTAASLSSQEIVLREQKPARWIIEVTKKTTIGPEEAAQFDGVSNRFIVQDRRGRLYHSNVHQLGTLLVFDSAGKFLRTVGRDGQGPGGGSVR